MISPEIWASSSFAELNDFAKLVFIGLISNADDEGKGEADPALLKSTLFPRDEKKRAADVKSALSEIARSTSTLLYSVEGKNYYILTKWKAYQKLDRPTLSKLPNPPETMGERGRTTQNQDFDEGSTNTRRMLDEGSPIEKNKNKNKNINNTPNSAGAREEVPTEFEKRFKAFCEKWDIEDDNYYSPLIVEFDFDKLDEAYSESPKFLADKEAAPWAHTLSGVAKAYHSIIAHKYKDRAGAKASSKTASNQQTSDMLNNIFNHYKAEEEGDGTN